MWQWPDCADSWSKLLGARARIGGGGNLQQVVPRRVFLSAIGTHRDRARCTVRVFAPVVWPETQDRQGQYHSTSPHHPCPARMATRSAENDFVQLGRGFLRHALPV